MNDNLYKLISNSYYGGMVDVYKPYGINLYHYDINSLYPYIMQKYKMPVSKPKLTTNKDINNIFGFVLVKVLTPKNIVHPILPRKNESNIIELNKGKWID